MKKISILIILVIIFCGCDYLNTNKIKKTIEEGQKEATDSLNSIYTRRSDSLNTIYKQIIDNQFNKAEYPALKNYHNNLISTINYIDSLRRILVRFNDTVSTGNQTLFDDSTKSKMLQQIKLTYNLALDIAKTNQMKLEIQKSQAAIFNIPNVSELSNFYFGSNNPEQVTWILYGLEEEILKIGIDGFSEY